MALQEVSPIVDKDWNIMNAKSGSSIDLLWMVRFLKDQCHVEALFLPWGIK